MYHSLSRFISLAAGETKAIGAFPSGDSIAHTEQLVFDDMRPVNDPFIAVRLSAARAGALSASLPKNTGSSDCRHQRESLPFRGPLIPAAPIHRGLLAPAILILRSPTALGHESPTRRVARVRRAWRTHARGVAASGAAGGGVPRGARAECDDRGEGGRGRGRAGGRDGGRDSALGARMDGGDSRAWCVGATARAADVPLRQWRGIAMARSVRLARCVSP